MDEDKQNETISPIRTYQSDVQEILKSGEGSLAKIAIAENDRKAKEPFVLERPETGERKGIVYGISAILILLGISTLVFLYFSKSSQNDTSVALIEQTPPIIAADSEKTLSIKGLEKKAIIAALLAEVKNDKVALSSLLSIKISDAVGTSTKPISPENFLEKLQSRAPDELVRSLGESFMFGLHSLNTNKPFLILKTNYYQNAFAGMIAWEKYLREDLGPIFIEEEPLAFASTSKEAIGQKTLFEDLVVKNRDTRALKNQNGEIIFLYSFPDKNTIVITTNADTLEKISGRILTNKMVR